MEVTSFGDFKGGYQGERPPPIVAEIPFDLETAVSLFSRFRNERYSFLLESVAGGEKWGRYCFIGLDPSLVCRIEPDHLDLTTSDGGREKRPFRDLPEALRKILRDGAPAPSSLLRFAGGMVGFLSYDAVRFFEKIPARNPDKLRLPAGCLMIPTVVLILDNLRQTLEIVCFPQKGPSQKAYQAGLSKIKKVLKRVAGRPSPARAPGGHVRWRANLDLDGYCERVRQAKEYILAGDTTQTVLSIRFVGSGRRDPFEVYRRLRRLNPSPYLFMLNLGDVSLVGASPETMVHYEGGEAILRPIAGTRPRGRTEEEDRRMEVELLSDPKERAEHVMLVDLGRNDLGRVAEAASVKVDELMSVERYSHVMHIVSNIRARLKRGQDALDLLRAAFPAGTLTGSPKIRAMQIIEELEPVRRGTYGGSVGYLSFNGNMDMAITIRSALFHKGKIYVQAGAGIVADSVPEREYQECLNKARAMMEAIEGT